MADKVKLPEIKKIARKAGGEERMHEQWSLHVSDLERFFQAAFEIGAAAELEKLKKKIAALEADVDHFFKLSGQYLERANKAEEAVAAEREKCAALCESFAYAAPDWTNETALALAEAIRGMR